MAQTFLFYDLETTGRSPSQDQVIQFAAIRADHELKELERHNFVIKLNPDVVPDPYAMVTHRISLSDLENGMNEFEAARRIHELINTPETINIGYNNLAFDDEFLRFMFYRNLLEPYTHQFKNGCQRADMMLMTIAFYLYCPGVINWPQADGRPSLKLEALQHANNLSQGQAHDALTDVEATLNLARCFKEQSEMWHYLLTSFSKQTEIQRIRDLPIAVSPDMRQALLVDPGCRARNAYQWPVLGLGGHYHYTNQSIWLRLDHPDLSQIEQPSEAWSYSKKAGENGLLLPPKERFYQQMSSERQQMWQHNLRFLQTNPQLLERLKQYFCDHTYPVYEGVDPDAGLYVNGFPTDEERAACVQFHRLGPKEQSRFMERLTSSNLLARAARVLARHYPQYLSEPYKQDFDRYVQSLYQAELEPPINHKGEAKRTVNDAVNVIDSMDSEGLDEQQRSLLGELSRYLRQKL